MEKALFRNQWLDKHQAPLNEANLFVTEYHWSDDANRDGFAELLKQDPYPESTALCELGIMRLSEAMAK